MIVLARVPEVVPDIGTVAPDLDIEVVVLARVPEIVPDIPGLDIAVVPARVPEVVPDIGTAAPGLDIEPVVVPGAHADRWVVNSP